MRPALPAVGPAAAVRAPAAALPDLLRSREAIVAGLILALVAAASLASPYFLTLLNLKNVLIGCAVELVLAVGLAVVMVHGGIDLSVGSVVGLCAVALAVLLDRGLGLPLSLVATFALGLAAGALNGVVIAYLGVNALVATLGTMTMGRSGVYILSGGYALSAIPPGFKAFFNAEVLGLPVMVWVPLGLVLAGDLLVRGNVVLRKFRFIGGGEAAALRAGIAVRRLKAASYAALGLLGALAAVLIVARMGSAFPNTGQGLEIRVVTALVVGGCSIYGGRGSVLGAALGVVFLALVANVLVLTGVSVYWQGVASGAILILAVLSDVALNRRRGPGS